MLSARGALAVSRYDKVWAFKNPSAYGLDGRASIKLPGKASDAVFCFKDSHHSQLWPKEETLKVANNVIIAAPANPMNKGDQRFQSRNAKRQQSAICGFAQSVMANNIPLLHRQFVRAP